MRFRELNRAFLRILGYAESELIGKTFIDVTHPEDVELDVKQAEQLFAGKISSYQIEKRYVRKDGKLIWVRLTATVFRHDDSLVGLAMVEDIDDQKRTEDALKASEEKLRRTLDDAPLGIGMCDSHGRWMYCNRAVTSLLGYDREELCGTPVDDLTHPEDLERDRTLRLSLIVGKVDRYQSEKRMRRRDGSYVWTRVHVKSGYNSGDQSIYAMAVIKDISEEKRLSEALAKTEESLKTILSNLPIVLFSLAPDGTITLSEGMGLEKIGLKSSDRVGVNALEVSSDSSELTSDLKRALNGERVTAIRLRGGVIWETHYFPIRDANGALARVIGFSVDVTEREKSAQLVSEQQKLLVQNAKLTALGQMASGISHEINNPLTVIYGAACQLHRLADSERLDVAKARALSVDIQDTSRRIEKIIDGLRAFSREEGGEDFETVGVGQLVSDTLRFCEERIRIHGIRLEVDRVPEDWKMICRPVQISEILLNLLNNAHDAAFGRPSPWIEVHVKATSEWIVLSVDDSGAGIDPSLREMIFQPFFTTKPVGQGTGLGLSISRGLADANRCEFFYDVEGAHTRFVLKVPRAGNGETGDVLK